MGDMVVHGSEESRPAQNRDRLDKMLQRSDLNPGSDRSSRPSSGHGTPTDTRRICPAGER
jgi:hypothetical protein